MLEESFWCGNSVYQKEYEEIKHLVPLKGPSETLEGEVLKAVSGYYYDFYNNGFGNDKTVDEQRFLKVFAKKWGLGLREEFKVTTPYVSYKKSLDEVDGEQSKVDEAMETIAETFILEIHKKFKDKDFKLSKNEYDSRNFK
jgi:hypothetical protein